jgi:hypothetical protein
MEITFLDSMFGALSGGTFPHLIIVNNSIGTQPSTSYGGGSFSFEMSSIGMLHVVRSTPLLFPNVNMLV